MTGITPNGQVTINAIALTNFCGYDFNGASGQVDYALGNLNEGNFIPYLNNSITIPNEIVQNWGENDDVIWDYVINQIQN